MPVLHLLAPDEEAIASKACANKFFYSDLSLYGSRTRRKTIIRTMSIGHGIVATGDPKAGQLENVGLTLTCSVEILAAPKLPSAVVTFCLVYLASSPNLQGKCTSQDQPLI